MSADWVLYLDNSHLPSSTDIENSNEFTKHWHYSITELRSLTDEAWWPGIVVIKDMTPSEMQTVADQLEEIHTHHENVSANTERVLADAQMWLSYWADKGFSITTLY